MVGTTSKNIIFVGDSAGGNLNTACLVKIIESGVRKPFGIFNIFTPFYLDFLTSPARYLSFLDPLLSYGFAMVSASSFAESLSSCIQLTRLFSFKIASLQALHIIAGLERDQRAFAGC